MSGGPALTMRVPSSAADGPLLCEGTELLTFVEYLRTCLRNDGFLNGRLPGVDERPPPPL